MFQLQRHKPQTKNPAAADPGRDQGGPPGGAGDAGLLRQGPGNRELTRRDTRHETERPAAGDGGAQRPGAQRHARGSGAPTWESGRDDWVWFGER